MNEKKQYVIIGSGAGGATLAKELAKKHHCNVTVIDKGTRVDKVGNTISASRFYDNYGLLRSIEGVFIHKTAMLGGTTVVSCGNIVRSSRLQKLFLNLGINLDRYLDETEQEIEVTTLPQTETANKIMKAARNLGYNFTLMPKAVKNCKNCGNCVLGCKFNSKWTALKYLDEAKSYGARIIDQAVVTRVLSMEGKISGVEMINKKVNGLEVILGDVIILAAGGIGTPIILQNSGFEYAGKQLFCDLFNVTYGITKEKQSLGLNMPIVDMEFCESDGFILSPFMDPLLQFAIFAKLKLLFHKRTIGIMTKINDQAIGSVRKDGTISKSVTEQDRKKLDKGAAISKEILINAGAKSNSIFKTSVRGAHPGGTAAIGDVVDKNLETDIKNLYVCDCSVFPFAPGLPPILTIIALAKWLANRIS